MNTASDNFRGAALMAAAMAAFTLNDAVMKVVSSDLTLFQTIFLRGIVTSTMIGLMAWSKRELFYPIAKPDRKILFWRLVGEIGGTLCFLTALFNMPIANATAILQALPLAVTLAAALFLGEKVGWRRYLAIAIGFAGILIIVRPGSDGFNVYSFWALTAVGFIVLRDLLTRRLSRQVPSLFVAFLTSISITLTGALLAPTMEWHPVTGENLLLLLVAAFFVLFGYLFSIMTMRVGDIGFVSPFRYSALIWAILLGIVVFDNIPDLWTLIGSSIVVAMGMFTFYRERKLRSAGKQD
jgi:drug/metabolite transporter (DMT)-like permease